MGPLRNDITNLKSMEKVYNYNSFESGTRIAIRNQKTGMRSGLALDRGLKLACRDEQLLLLLGGH